MAEHRMSTAAQADRIRYLMQCRHSHGGDALFEVQELSGNFDAEYYEDLSYEEAERVIGLLGG